MLQRALKVVPLSAGISSVVYLFLIANAGTTPAPAAFASLLLERQAYAQSPATPRHYDVVAEQSEVRYRIREQLASINFPSDAVGTTKAVEGSVALDTQGRVLANDSRLVVDLRTVRSDAERRDNYVRRNTLETERYPTVVFVPTEMRGLPFPLPRTGTASFELIGDLTVRDATRRVTWEATATFNEQNVNVQAKTGFRFAEFGLTIPRVASVLSVEDNIRLEADLVLRPRL